MKGFQNSQTYNTERGRHLEVEVVLGRSLEKMIRYRAALKRELHKAMEMLHSLQAERRERGETREREGGES